MAWKSSDPALLVGCGALGVPPSLSARRCCQNWIKTIIIITITILMIIVRITVITMTIVIIIIPITVIVIIMVCSSGGGLRKGRLRWAGGGSCRSEGLIGVHEGALAIQLLLSFDSLVELMQNVHCTASACHEV